MLEKIVKKQDKTNTEKMYHPRRNPRIELQKNFETLPTNFLSGHQNNPELQPRTFRKNQISINGENITSLTERQPIPLSREEDNTDV